MSRRRALRGRIAAEAARLMLEEGVKEYFTAKHLAADALLGMRRSPSTPLPTNREIRSALIQRTGLQTATRGDRLRRMRQIAVRLMELLSEFQPRLIGSVASGAIHPQSDIDLQLFTRRLDRLEHMLWLEGFEVEMREVEALRAGRKQRFVHYHFDVADAPVELSIYDPEELEQIAYSSIDGKAIDRVPVGRVRAMLRARG